MFIYSPNVDIPFNERLLGDILIAGSALAWACSSILKKKMMTQPAKDAEEPLSPLHLTVWASTIGFGIQTVPFIAEVSQVGISNPSFDAWVDESFSCFLMYFQLFFLMFGLQMVLGLSASAGPASMYVYLVLFHFGIFSGWLLLDEKLGLSLLISFVLIVSGLLISQYKHNSENENHLKQVVMNLTRIGLDMQIQTVAVIGAGTMGAGIAQVCAQSGWKTNLFDAFEDGLARGMDRINAFWDKGITRGKTTAEQKQTWAGNLFAFNDFQAAIESADLIIEAVPEIPELKAKIFADLSEFAPAHAILATNTSSLSIKEIADATNRPANVIGMHFFNPVPLMKLLEIVRSEYTSQEVVDIAKQAGEQMGKTCIVVKDVPGFATSRLESCPRQRGYQNASRWCCKCLRY